MANKTPAEWLARPGDSDETRNEIAELLARGFRVSRPTHFQLKIARFNYYPNTGRITIDPCHRHSKRGFDALIELLDAAVSRGEIKIGPNAVTIRLELPSV
jgi:hypothetical protein